VKWIILLMLIPSMALADCRHHHGHQRCKKMIDNIPIITDAHGSIRKKIIPSTSYDVVQGAAEASLFGDWEAYVNTKVAYLQFDTSRVGATGTITRAQLYRKFAGLSPSNPDSTFDFRYRIGTAIPLLDENQDLSTDPTYFEYGTEAYAEFGLAAEFTNPYLIDLGDVGIANINKTGITTFIIPNVSNWWANETQALWEFTTNPCYLRLTYRGIVEPTTKKFLFALGHLRLTN
jgi:hypothetical protein